MSSHLSVAKHVDEVQLITVRIQGQLLGIPISDVKEILQNQNIAPIPLVPKEIAGSLNLRGRIVTVIDIRHRLHLSGRTTGTPSTFVVVESRNELYSVLADTIGDVLTISKDSIEDAPPNLSASWRDVSSGVHKLQNELLVLLNLPKLLSFQEIN